MGVVLK